MGGKHLLLNNPIVHVYAPPRDLCKGPGANQDICMKRIIIHLFLVTILTQSCLPKSEHVDRLWFYTYSSGDAKNEVTEVTPASFLYLKSDGSYTRDFGKFDYGSWKLEKSELVLSSKTNQLTSARVFAKTPVGQKTQLEGQVETQKRENI